ncbi:MAG TPA: YafY family protein [Thermomicrobiales bacterium]|nr:YafY family protein [Thermomicrobiales bacterium]
MIETSARLLRLLSLLQARRDWPGSELADRLAVSSRTIRNDIERLRQLGYPVDATRGATGGYRLGTGATMPPLLLDDEEAVAVVVGLIRVTNGGIADVEESSLRALTKLEQILPARLRRRVDAMRTFAVQVPPDSTGPTVSAETLSLLANACRDREKLRIAYARYDGETSRRIVEPHRVVNWDRRWYLVAWDDDRTDWRTFRVDRIARLDPTGLRFGDRDLPEGNITTYVARNVARAGWRYTARFRVQAAAEVVLDRINPAVGIVEAVDDETCILMSGADSLDTVAVYIGMLGFDFTVEDPPELIAYLRATAERYQRAIS